MSRLTRSNGRPLGDNHQLTHQSGIRQARAFPSGETEPPLQNSGHRSVQFFHPSLLTFVSCPFADLHPQHPLNSLSMSSAATPSPPSAASPSATGPNAPSSASPCVISPLTSSNSSSHPPRPSTSHGFPRARKLPPPAQPKMVTSMKPFSRPASQSTSSPSPTAPAPSSGSATATKPQNSCCSSTGADTLRP